MNTSIGPNTSNSRPVIGVIGASSAEEKARNIAEAVGAAIGAAGWHLVCGGGGGVMAAACRGHRSVQLSPGERGVTIGILPSDDSASANPYVDVSIPTGIGLARNAVVARASMGIVAVGGCSGTLSEIALAWQFGRPIAAMTTAGGWAAKLAGSCLDNRYDRPIFAADTPQDALRFLSEQLALATR
jgi:uncharacterized protein (TIGR00725 family)